MPANGGVIVTSERDCQPGAVRRLRRPLWGALFEHNLRSAPNPYMGHTVAISAGFSHIEYPTQATLAATHP